MIKWLGINYNLTTKISLILLYILILAGGVVRCTGSGMGCPDWPKCFGMLIPPTSVNELPENYEEIFIEGRIKKNERLSSVLSLIGLEKLSDKIKNDPDIKKGEEFNVYKTWTEYINRLIGALVGFSLILVFLSSLFIRPVSRKLILLSFLSLILVFFQAWVGSIVVSTNLLSGLITFHVIVALLIICNVILCYHLSSISNNKQIGSVMLNFFIISSLILFIIQMVLGTEVRESVDELLKLYGFNFRENIIESLNNTFKIHRSFSILILLFQILTVVTIYIKFKSYKFFRFISLLMLLLIISEILVGAGMAYFSIPKILQPIHLFIAFLAFGLQFYILLLNFSLKKI
jgi:cytochrome c oxidase assembly protein subunit 15